MLNHTYQLVEEYLVVGDVLVQGAADFVEKCELPFLYLYVSDLNHVMQIQHLVKNFVLFMIVF